MDRCVILVLLHVSCGNARIFCDASYRPLEVGKWVSSLKHLDSGVVENNPVTMSEGQVYVYENEFPGYIISYIHVDNLAIKTCGANAVIKAGGLGESSVLIIIHAEANNEIRSVVDIWGVKSCKKDPVVRQGPRKFKNMKSLYLVKDFRTVNHNIKY